MLFRADLSRHILMVVHHPRTNWYDWQPKESFREEHYGQGEACTVVLNQ